MLEPLVTLCNYSSFNEAQTPVPVYCLILQTNTNTKQTQNLPLYQFPCSTKVRLKNSRQRENNQIGPFKERMEEHVSCSVGGFSDTWPLGLCLSSSVSMEASRPGTTTFIHVVQNLSTLLETARRRLISFLAASLLAAQLNIKKSTSCVQPS